MSSMGAKYKIMDAQGIISPEKTCQRTRERKYFDDFPDMEAAGSTDAPPTSAPAT